MDAVHAAADCVCAVGQLGKHAAAHDAVFNQFLRLGYVDAADQGIRLIQASQNTGDVGQIDKFVGAHGTGNGTRRLISIDIVSVEIIIHAQGRDDRQIVFLKQVKENFGIDVSDFADKADILSVCIFFLDMEEISVLAADTDSADTEFGDHRDQLLGYAAQDHLGDLAGLRVRDTQSIDKLRFLTALLDPAADGLAAAVHDDGLEADELEQGNILDDTALQLFIAHCAAAVLDDDDLAVEFLNIGERLDQHLCLLLRLCLFFIQIRFHIFYFLPDTLYSIFQLLSAAVICVDLDIIIGQIASPGSGGCLTHVELSQNGDLFLLQKRGSFLLAVIRGCAFGEDQHVPVAVHKIQLQIIGIKIDARITQCAEDTAPVGVASVYCRLGQAGADDRFGQNSCILNRVHTLHIYFDELGRAFAVAGHLHSQISADCVQGLIKCLIGRAFRRTDHSISRLAVRQHQQGVVCGGISVHRDHIEGLVDNGAHGCLQDICVHSGIRSHIAQHGAHIGMDHTRTLGHAADCHGLPFDFKGAGTFLFVGICGHNGPGRGCAVLQILSQALGQRRDARPDAVDGKLETDDAGGADQNGICRDIQTGGCSFSRLTAVIQSFLPGAGIGNTGVDDHGVHGLSALNQVSVPDDRRRLDDVSGKSTGRSTGRSTVDHRHIRSALIFDLRGCRCSRKAFCGCDAALNSCHFHASHTPPLLYNNYEINNYKIIYYAQLSTYSS